MKCKKLVSAVLSMALVFSVWMAGGAAAVFAADVIEYPLYVGGVKITADNKDDITKAINDQGKTDVKASGIATFEPSEEEGVLGTLKLDGFTLEGPLQCGIFEDVDNFSDLTIELSGTNTISTTGAQGESTAWAEGIYTGDDLIIGGEGSLSVNVAGNYINSGLDAKSIVIESGASVTATTGECYESSYAVLAFGTSLTVESGATLVANAGESTNGNVYGCFFQEKMTVEGTVKATAAAAEYCSYGIYGEGSAYGDVARMVAPDAEDLGVLVVNGGTVTVTGVNYGINTKAVTINDNATVTVSASGGEDVEYGCGIKCVNLNVSGSTLDVSTGVAEEVYGIVVQDAIFNDSTVKAIGNAKTLSAGIYGEYDAPVEYTKEDTYKRMMAPEEEEPGTEDAGSEPGATITINGGSVTAFGTYMGIYFGYISIEKATVEASADFATAVVAEQDLLISGATVNAKAGGVGIASYGDITIEDSVVDAESTAKADEELYGGSDLVDVVGIFAMGNINISGKDTVLTAKGSFKAIYAGMNEGEILFDLPLEIVTPEDGYLGFLDDDGDVSEDKMSVLTGKGEDAEFATEVVIKVPTFILTIDPGDGKPIEKEVKKGEKLDKPQDPEKDGHTFDGWYTEGPNGEEEKYNFDDPVTESKTIYAKWTKNPEPEPKSNDEPEEKKPAEPDPTKPVYTGTPTTYTQGSNVDPVITVNRDPDNASCHDHFTGEVEIKNQSRTYDPKRGEHFEDYSGSTVIKISAEYLDSLEPGEYTLTVYFDDGLSEIKFTIAEPEATPTPVPTATPTTAPTFTPTPTTQADKSKMPKSGDMGSIYPVLGVTVVVVSALAVVVLLRKRNQENID